MFRTAVRAFPVCLLAAALPATAQETHDLEHEGLHFSHPLITESVSPDTKLRLIWQRIRPDAEQEIEAEGEFAFVPSFSIEAGFHYEAGEGIGAGHLSLKGAHAFDGRGALLGYGVHAGLHEMHADTASGEAGGETALEVAPFLNAGVKRGDLELVAWVLADIEPGGEAGEGVGLRWDVSAVYHVGDRLQALIEYNARATVGGDPPEASDAITPGFKVRPLSNPALQIGVGWSVALTGSPGFHDRLVLSAFWHF